MKDLQDSEGILPDGSVLAGLASKAGEHWTYRFMYTPEGVVTFVNDACCRLLEQTTEKLVGKNFLLLVPRENALEVRDMVLGLSPGNPFGLMLQAHHLPAGSVLRQLWRHGAVFNEQGAVVSYFAEGREW